MAVGIITGAQGAPGGIGQTNRVSNSLFNEFNFIIPDWIPDMFDRYGRENYALIMEILNKSTLEDFKTQTQTFSHFEKGRSFSAGFVSANVTGVTAGAAVTFTLGTGSYWNSGTQTPFRLNEFVRIRSNGVLGRVTAINSTTANAWTVTVTPAQTTQLFASNATTTLSAGESIELIGNIAAGEASGRMDSQVPFIFRVDNTTTVIRDSAAISDVARMNKTQINFGGGDHYYYKFETTELNKRFLYYVENACLEGIYVNNLGSTLGTTGVIPQVLANGSSVNYLTGSGTITDLQNLTRVFDYNGGPSEYHALQDIKQRQDVNNTLFGKYNNGAIRYATVGGTEEAAVSYGFQSFSTDTYTLHFFRYKPFSASSVFGYTPNPTLGSFRDNFGLFVPQGAVPDAQNQTLRPNMQWVYQEMPDYPGQKMYTWETGAFSENGKTDTAEKVLNQICYVGARCIAPQQFAIFQGVAS